MSDFSLHVSGSEIRHIPCQVWFLCGDSDYFWRQQAGWRLVSEGALVCEMCPVYSAVNSGPVFGDHCIYCIRVYFGQQYRHTLTQSLQPLPSLYTYVPRLWCSILRSPPTPPQTLPHPSLQTEQYIYFFCGFEAFLCPLGMFIHTVCICIYCISFLRRSCSSPLIAQCTLPPLRGVLYSRTQSGEICANRVLNPSHPREKRGLFHHCMHDYMSK